jgi:DNA-binding PadR family transcriptional regulator
VTPIVARLENAGILTHRVEEVDPAKAGRPRRKYYSFTPDGAERARNALARSHAAAASATSARHRPGLAGEPA